MFSANAHCGSCGKGSAKDKSHCHGDKEGRGGSCESEEATTNSPQQPEGSQPVNNPGGSGTDSSQ